MPKSVYFCLATLHGTCFVFVCRLVSRTLNFFMPPGSYEATPIRQLWSGGSFVFALVLAAMAFVLFQWGRQLTRTWHHLNEDRTVAWGMLAGMFLASLLLGRYGFPRLDTPALLACTLALTALAWLLAVKAGRRR